MSQTLLNDRYRLEDELDQGGMGKSHRAFDMTLEREVAIKLVKERILGFSPRAWISLTLAYKAVNCQTTRRGMSKVACISTGGGTPTANFGRTRCIVTLPSSGLD